MQHTGGSSTAQHTAVKLYCLYCHAGMICKSVGERDCHAVRLTKVVSQQVWLEAAVVLWRVVVVTALLTTGDASMHGRPQVVEASRGTLVEGIRRLLDWARCMCGGVAVCEVSPSGREAGQGNGPAEQVAEWMAGLLCRRDVGVCESLGGDRLAAGCCVRLPFVRPSQKRLSWGRVPSLVNLVKDQSCLLLVVGGRWCTRVTTLCTLLHPPDCNCFLRC